MSIAIQKPQNPAEKIISELENNPQFADFNTMFKTTKAKDKFIRSFRLSTAMNPQLLQADRPSLFFSLYKAAHDGLIVDNVNAALVIFNAKVGETWIKKVQYFPMVKGVRNKIYELCGFLIDAQVVYSNDKFIWEQGDHPKLIHIPSLEEEIGKPIAVYAIAKDKTGQIVDRTVMRFSEVMAIAKKSKSGWDDKAKKLIGIWFEWLPEMCKKTVVHRLAKYLPVPDEVDDEQLRRVLSRNIEDADEYTLDVAKQPLQLDIQNQQPIVPVGMNAVIETMIDDAKPAENNQVVAVDTKMLKLNIMNTFCDKMDLLAEKNIALHDEIKTAMSNGFAGLSDEQIANMYQRLDNE